MSTQPGRVGTGHEGSLRPAGAGQADPGDRTSSLQGPSFPLSGQHQKPLTMGHSPSSQTCGLSGSCWRRLSLMAASLTQVRVKGRSWKGDGEGQQIHVFPLTSSQAKNLKLSSCFSSIISGVALLHPRLGAHLPGLASISVSGCLFPQQSQLFSLVLTLAA